MMLPTESKETQFTQAVTATMSRTELTGIESILGLMVMMSHTGSTGIEFTQGLMVMMSRTGLTETGFIRGVFGYDVAYRIGGVRGELLICKFLIWRGTVFIFQIIA